MELADFYIHARFRELSRSEFENMARLSEEYIIGHARAFSERHGPTHESEFIYYFDEGSLKQKAKIIGGLVLATYVTLSHYSDFRKSVIELYDDARAFGDAAVQEFQNATGVIEEDILYRRSVSRDVNQLHRIVKNVDLLTSGHLPETEAMEYREAIASDIVALQLAHPIDYSIQRLLEVVPRRHLPFVPRNIDDLVAIVTQRRWEKEELEVPAGKRRPRGRLPPARVPRYRYERTLRL
jgi:hypothetical protein